MSVKTREPKGSHRDPRFKSQGFRQDAHTYCAVVQPQQSPGGPEGAMRRRRVEIRQLHSSEAGEALIRLLQVQVDFYIFFFGID